jgi:hypothetical protein
MSDVPHLGFEAVKLLLSIVETPGLAISANALDEFHQAGPALVTAGAIKPDGFEPVAVSHADHDDAIVRVTWSTELSGYAYFNPSAGLVRIDDDRLRRYRLDISWFLEWIAGHLSLGIGCPPVCVIPNRLWTLGNVWLGATKRTRRRTAIYVARRLTEPETVTQLGAVVRLRSTKPGMVILTTTDDLHLARTVSADACAVLPLKTCARAGIENFELDSAVIYSAAYGFRASRTNLPVQADAGFRIVRVGDREFQFYGDKQRQVVNFLYNRWQNREGPISTAVMFEELEWENTRRLRDLFKGHADWQELIGYKNGTCWLRCDELLAELGSTG